MQFKAKSFALYLFLALAVSLIGCDSKKLLEELKANTKNNLSEINQLKNDQQKAFEGATKIALETKKLVEIVDKLNSDVIEIKKNSEKHLQKINKLEQDVSMLKEAPQPKPDNQVNVLNEKPKGIRMPDGSFIPNIVTNEIKTTKQSELSPERNAFALQKAYAATRKNLDGVAIFDLNMFQKMLLPGTSQEKVMEVMGAPDQESSIGGWVYLGKVRNKITGNSNFLRIRFSDGRVTSVESN